MRAVLLALSLGALAACGGQTCALSASGSVSLAAAEERDAVLTRAEGQSCGAATATFEVQNPQGETLYTMSAPIGDLVQSITAQPTNADIQTFLTAWASPEASYTALAPPWETLTPDANVELDRAAYEAVRARQWRMICPLSARGVESCLYWDPDAERVARLFDRRIRPE